VSSTTTRNGKLRYFPRNPERVCVMGLGYIGLPTAAMFATHGKRVLGVDVNPTVVETLRRGEIHIEEPGLAAFVQAALTSGQLDVSTEPAPADVFILAVPTPCRADHKPDVRYVESAARMVAPFLRPGNLVILESTSPPGTTVGLIPILEESGLRVGEEILLAHSPERVLPGRILTELVQNDRVIGGQNQAAAEAGALLYRSFVTGEILLTDATTAELVKLMENTYRDVNIALANEFGRVAATVGINVHEAIALANHHPRVNILKPGPGVGGHCIAVDPWFIVDAAPDVTPLIQTARKVNDDQPEQVAEMIARAVAAIPQPTIAVLGLAYKADIDDLRESPSMEIVHLLERRGLDLRLHDAHATVLPDGTLLIPNLDDVLAGADALVVLTDHAAYRHLRPDELPAMRHRVVVDTRHCLDAAEWRAAGFAVHQLGVGARAGRALAGAAR
jgi:UDP-N-acetyl-D-mannosaminuronic acid dehydrogenase